MFVYWKGIDTSNVDPETGNKTLWGIAEFKDKYCRNNTLEAARLVMNEYITVATASKRSVKVVEYV
jgi:hypothetical protein